MTMFAMISVSDGYGTDGSSTPTMVAVRSPSLTVFPSTEGSLWSVVAPEAISQHRGPRRLRPVVGRPEQAAAHRLEAHHLEVRTADDAGADHAGLAEADHRELDRREVAEGVERPDACAKIVDLRHREDGVLDTDARRALADIDEAIFVAVDERPEEHAADHAEDGGVGADAERERDDNREGQPLDPGERPEGETEIGEEAHKHSVTRSRAR